MKIAIVSSVPLSGKGGMERVISTWVRELEKRGDKVELIINTRGFTDMEWLRDFKYHEIKAPKALEELIYCLKLTNILNRMRPDLVIGVDLKALKFLKPYRLLRKKEVRVGSWLHFTLTQEKQKHKVLLNYADFHLAISSGIAKEIQEVIRGNKSRVHIIYNPTSSTGEFIPRPGVPTFIYMGRLMYGAPKKVSDFLKALAQLNGEWQAIIIGDGADADKLKQLSIDLKIDSRIVWTGWVTKPWEHVPAATILVLSSTFEGFPMVLIEALNRGIPCISSDCPTGPSDIIQNGQNGWMYPVHDINALATLLQRVIDVPACLPSQAQVKETGKRFSTETIINNIRMVLLQETVHE